LDASQQAIAQRVQQAGTGRLTLSERARAGGDGADYGILVVVHRQDSHFPVEAPVIDATGFVVTHGCDKTERVWFETRSF
jgi:hypothetical protein